MCIRGKTYEINLRRAVQLCPEPAGPDRWLHDEDIVKDYQECLEYSTRQEKQLMEALDDPARKQFEIYIGNVQGVRDYERVMFFCQGLAMGLELGVRACN